VISLLPGSPGQQEFIKQHNKQTQYLKDYKNPNQLLQHLYRSIKTDLRMFLHKWFVCQDYCALRCWV